ncbi:MAG TPA: fimbrial protein [Buttiauxella sp.]|jgi:type 1 fimbria pilin
MNFISRRTVYSFCACIFSVLSFCTFAANNTGSFNVGEYKSAGHGVVRMPGAIIDAACAISIESRDQTLNLHLASISSLLAYGYGSAEYFVIKLVHCTRVRSDGVTEWKNITATFSGDTDRYNNTLFSLTGDVRGVGVQLRDDNSNIIIPGEVVSRNQIPLNIAEMRYSVRLVADSNKIESGVGHSTIRLRLDYD